MSLMIVKKASTLENRKIKSWPRMAKTCLATTFDSDLTHSLWRLAFHSCQDERMLCRAGGSRALTPGVSHRTAHLAAVASIYPHAQPSEHRSDTLTPFTLQIS